MLPSKNRLIAHQQALSACSQCPGVFGPPVVGNPVITRILLLGQAPGDREITLHRPFAWTAGKTLFTWFETIGINEKQCRQQIYMAAVCRCFPGKNPKGGDRVPATDEIKACAQWLNQELDILQPQLIIPVGKLAISQFLKFKRLTEVIGQQHLHPLHGKMVDIIPLPHPSGISTWHRTEPGKSLLTQALLLIQSHPQWQQLNHTGPDAD